MYFSRTEFSLINPKNILSQIKFKSMKRYWLYLMIAVFLFGPEIKITGQQKSDVKSAMSIVSGSALPSKAEVIDAAVRVNRLWQAERAPELLDKLWYSGVYHAGNMRFHAVWPVEEFLNYSKVWAEHNKWEIATHPTADADSYIAGQTYIDLYKLEDSKDLKKIEAILRRVESRLTDKQSAEWWWIDAMYMAMPVYARIGLLTGENRYFEKMFSLFKNCRDTLLVSPGKYLWSDELRELYGEGPMIARYGAVPDGLYNEKDGLWWRDWGFQPGVPPKRDPNNGRSSSDTDPDSEFCAKHTPNGKMIYWGRGNGWAIAAMAHTLHFMPEGAPHRKEYVDMLQQMAEALKPRQRSDGFWNMSLDDPRHHAGGETSGTALITYALAWGINHHLIDYDTYYPVVAAAWNGLLSEAVQPDGVLTKIQGEGEAPILPAALMTSQHPDKKVAFGVGAFLMAASEILQLAPGEVPQVVACKN